MSAAQDLAKAKVFSTTRNLSLAKTALRIANHATTLLAVIDAEKDIIDRLMPMELYLVLLNVLMVTLVITSLDNA